MKAAPMRTQEQKRAAHALKCVREVKGLKESKPEEIAARYRGYVESLPAHIVMGGLGQAVATQLAAARFEEKDRKAGHKAHAELVKHLGDWLHETVYAGEQKNGGPGWLLGAITQKDQQFYLRAQAEALAWLVWLKKLCQAMLPKTEAEDD